MNVSTIATLTITIPEFRFADSLMPMTRINVTSAIAMNATRLNTPCTCGSPAGSTPCDRSVGRTVASRSQRPLYITIWVPGVAVNVGGI